MKENVFTILETASILKKTVKDTKYLLKSKRLKCIIISGRVRVRENHLNEFFALTGRATLKIQMTAKK